MKRKRVLSCGRCDAILGEVIVLVLTGCIGQKFCLKCAQYVLTERVKPKRR